MGSSPLFSVIIPTYNRANFLKRAIDSVLVQTFKDFELIIVDDGSTDNTKELINLYSDSRIKYIYKKNGGLNSARNKGLENANGRYIAFCDSDDSWLPLKLEKHINKYNEDNDIKVVYDLTGILTSQNGISKIVLARNDTCQGWCYKKVLEQGYLTSPTFLSCKKECFDKVGILSMDLTNCEDDDFCFRLCKYFKVGLIKEILGVYYSDAPNRISAMKKMCADDFLKFQEKWSNEIISVCGKELLKHRYLQASYNYFEINEFEKAKEIFLKAYKIVGFSYEKDELINSLLKNREIIIYGIGDWGQKIYNALKIIDYHNITFAVSRTKEPIENFFCSQVQDINSLIAKKSMPIIIASSKYYNEMKEKAEQVGFNQIISYQKIIKMIFKK